MILDTNFLVALKAGHRRALEFAAELEAAEVPTRIPTVVVLEVYRSVGAGNVPNENAREYEALLANKPVVDLDANIGRRAGTLEGVHLSSDSKPNLGTVDAVVAATGLVYNEAIVTDDADFESVDGLRVERFDQG